MNRRRLMPLLVLLLAGVTAVLLVIIVNLAWFDEPLLPELEALRQPQPVALDGNAYPFAMGFLATKGQDPRTAGLEVVAALRGRREQGQPATLGKDEMRAILGSPTAHEGVEAILRFHCQARHHLNCADRLATWITSVDLDRPQLALLLERYETLLEQEHYEETPEPDFATPWPPLGPIVALGRLRLAMSFRDDTTPVFLEKASRELSFWRMTLREGGMLGTKMVALAAIRNAHDFLSASMRARELGSNDLEALRRIVRPFTREESDIGIAFVSEARAHLFSGVPPDTQGASWPIRLLVQKNATFNQHYRETIEPMRLRASLSAREYYEREAHQPLRREFRLTPITLYNFGGKFTLSRSPWDVHQFPSRVHDEQGRIELLLLQAELEERPDLDVATVVRTSGHRNPYTNEPMEYDPLVRTIGFVCLHTAFHPPEPADHCAVALGPQAP